MPTLSIDIALAQGSTDVSLTTSRISAAMASSAHGLSFGHTDEATRLSLASIRKLLSRWEPDLSRIAKVFDVAAKDVVRQIRLHLPQYELPYLEGEATIPVSLERILSRRFSGYPSILQAYDNAAGVARKS